MSERFIIESHAREFFLWCSKANRAGKFKRVSEESLDDVNALVDSIVRQVESKIPTPLHPLPPTPESYRLISAYAMEQVRDRLEAAVRKVIANKVQSTPSKGITL